MTSSQVHVCGTGGNHNCYPNGLLGGSRSRRVRRGGVAGVPDIGLGGSRSRRRKTARRSRRGGRGYRDYPWIASSWGSSWW